MPKQKKSVWEKLTQLSDEDLSRSSEKVEVVLAEKKTKKPVVKKEKKVKSEEGEPESEQWLPGTVVGQLSVDLYDADDSLIIESTIAGVKSEDIDVTVEPDLITIRGERKKEDKPNKKKHYYQECFWGRFSRTLVLPVPVKPEGVKGNIKNGILTVVLPKADEKRKNVDVE